jgi:hypothetical protein
MNTDRTTDLVKKLQFDDMWRVGGAMARAFKLFERELRDDAREVWDVRTTGYQVINSNFAYAGNIPNACTPGPTEQNVLTTTFDYSQLGPTGPGGPGR